jgi:hypothetical protein
MDAMRRPLDPDRLRQVLDALGRACRGPGVVYLTGGATALLEGWRASTVDLDLKLDPEPDGAFAAIARIKEELDVNVELASPDDFLPELADWREHSTPVGRFGQVEVRHYDLRAQALAKLARGFERDVRDARAMLERGLVTCAALRAALEQMEPRLERFPRVSARELQGRLAELCPPVDGAR